MRCLILSCEDNCVSQQPNILSLLYYTCDKWLSLSYQGSGDESKMSNSGVLVRVTTTEYYNGSVVMENDYSSVLEEIIGLENLQNNIYGKEHWYNIYGRNHRVRSTIINIYGTTLVLNDGQRLKIDLRKDCHLGRNQMFL